jgi:hypothetical protein
MLRLLALYIEDLALDNRTYVKWLEAYLGSPGPK